MHESTTTVVIDDATMRLVLSKMALLLSRTSTASVGYEDLYEAAFAACGVYMGEICDTQDAKNAQASVRIETGTPWEANTVPLESAYSAAVRAGNRNGVTPQLHEAVELVLTELARAGRY